MGIFKRSKQTYRDKILKYEARIRAAHDNGVPPRQKDIDRLMYYVGRAEKKGEDHRVKRIDVVDKKLKQAKEALGAGGEVAIQAVVAAVAGPAGAAGVASSSVSSMLERAQKMLQAPGADEELDGDEDDDD
jgi:hypothetical protein